MTGRPGASLPDPRARHGDSCTALTLRAGLDGVAIGIIDSVLSQTNGQRAHRRHGPAPWDRHTNVPRPAASGQAGLGRAASFRPRGRARPRPSGRGAPQRRSWSLVALWATGRRAKPSLVSPPDSPGGKVLPIGSLVPICMARPRVARQTSKTTNVRCCINVLGLACGACRSGPAWISARIQD